jgi:hypothetical protein
VKVEFDNRSHLPDETVREVVDFLAARCDDVGKTVMVTIAARPRHYGSWGRAYWPLRNGGAGKRNRKWGRYDVRVYVGGRPRPEGYPVVWTYKKHAGPATFNNELEDFIHVLAHELRHVEQFHQAQVCYPGWRKTSNFATIFKKWEHMLPYASCEVQAELFAHHRLDAWRSRGIVDQSPSTPTQETP